MPPVLARLRLRARAPSGHRHPLSRPGAARAQATHRRRHRAVRATTAGPRSGRGVGPRAAATAGRRGPQTACSPAYHADEPRRTGAEAQSRTTAGTTARTTARTLRAPPGGPGVNVLANDQYQWFWWIAPILVVSALGLIA